MSDNSFWNDLVSAGWSPGFGAVWFYKVDLDPAFLVAHPDGWRGVDYIVGSRDDLLPANPGGKPVFTEAYENSTVVASFGAIEVRIVQDRRVVAGEAE